MRIYNWTYDYERDQDLYLVVSGDDQWALVQSELDPIAVQMLANSPPSAILIPVIEQVNQAIRLCYPVTGLRLLSTELRGKPLDGKGLYQLLADIAGTIERGREYLLDERNFVLHNDLIFTGQRAEDVKLVYLPVKNIPAARSVQDQLRQLLEEWVDHTGQLQLEAWRELIRRLESEDFSLAEMQNWCLEQVKATKGAASGEDAHTSLNDDMKFGEAPSVKPSPPPVAAAADDLPSDGGLKALSDIAKENEQNEEFNYFQELIPLEEASTFALDRVHRSMSWSERLAQPAVLTASVLGLAAVLAVCYLFPFPGSKIVMFGLLGAFITVISWMLVWERKKTSEQMSIFQEEEEDVLLDRPEGTSPVSPVFSTPKEPTMSLGSTDQTVFLGEAKDRIETGSDDETYLLVYTEGKMIRKLMIDKERFVIGRDTVSSDWVSEQNGVSRAHCELIKRKETDGSCALKDLGSKNGTYLNGAWIIPFKEYLLSDRDHIRVIDEEYEYRAGG